MAHSPASSHLWLVCGKCDALAIMEVGEYEIHCPRCGNVQIEGVASRHPFRVPTRTELLRPKEPPAPPAVRLKAPIHETAVPTIEKEEMMDDKERLKDIGKRFSAWMEKMELSDKDLADYLGSSQGYIQKMRSGRHTADQPFYILGELRSAGPWPQEAAEVLDRLLNETRRLDLPATTRLPILSKEVRESRRKNIIATPEDFSPGVKILWGINSTPSFPPPPRNELTCSTTRSGPRDVELDPHPAKPDDSAPIDALSPYARLIDFAGRVDLYELLLQDAEDNLRTPENQIIWILKTHLTR